MNVADLLTEVKDQLDFNPNLASADASILRQLNRHYAEVSVRHPWLFLQTEASIKMYATISGSSTVTASVGNGSHLVTLTGTTLPDEVGGQTFVGPDSTEYTIGYRASSTTFYTTAAYGGSTNGAATSWTIQFRRYALPSDCARPLGFISRSDDRGLIRFIDRRAEELAYLDRDQTGDPILMIEDDHLQWRAPDPVSVNSAGVEVAWAASVGTAGGDLTSGVEYEYCYLFYYADRASPPSLVVSATATATGKINLVGMEDTRNGTSATGKQRLLYRRDKTNNGRWLLIKTFGTADEATTTYTDSGSDPARYTYLASELSPQTTYQHIRAWYTVGEDISIRVRYLKKPRRLVANSDVPVWPEAYHPLLVYLTLQDTCLQHGMAQQAAMFEARGERLLKRMREVELARDVRDYVRGNWSKNLGRGERWGTPVKTDA